MDTQQPREPPAWQTRLVQWDMSHNAIPLAIFAYTAVWQTFHQRQDVFPVSDVPWTVLFYVACALLAAVILISVVRLCVFPQALSHDFNHPRLVNFFFLPVIIGSIAVLASPAPLRSVPSFTVAFYLLSTVQLALTLFLFGEWLFAASPTVSIYPLVFMQTIGFFLLSIIASTVHLPEQAFFMLSVGSLFWLLVFITNFQHVSITLSQKAETPAPTFFLFIAPPAQAALATLFLAYADAAPPDPAGLLDLSEPLEWPPVAKAFLYIDLFIYALMFRLFPTWWRSKFSIAWWAYVFPLSAAACAVIWRYQERREIFWAVLGLILLIVATVAVTVVAGCTVWAVWTGRTPNNKPAAEAYKKVWRERQERRSAAGVEDGEASAGKWDDEAV